MRVELLFLSFLRLQGRIAIFTRNAARGVEEMRHHPRLLLENMVEIGVQSVVLVVWVSVFASISLTVVGYATFRKFGGQDMVGVFVAMAVVRELGPVIAGAMAGSKSGSAMASLIANMRIKEQIDALEVMGVDSMGYLVLPRMIAAVLVTPLLVLISAFAALMTCRYYGAWQLGLTPGTFWEQIDSTLSFRDIWTSLIKGGCFGGFFSITATYFGYYAQRGAEGVGQATNRAMVLSAILIILGNTILTEIMYG